MKKILLFVFAVTLIAAWTVPSFAAEVTFSGDYEVRAFATDNDRGVDLNGDDDFTGAGECAPFNDDCSDSGSWIDQQFNLGVDARANENVSGFVELQIGDAAGQEGESSVWGGNTASGNNTTAGNSVNVDQAYINFNVGPVNIKAGRQDFNPAGDIFGLVMLQTYDAFTFSTAAGPANIYGAVVKGNENDSITGARNDDTNEYVLGGQFSPTEGMSAGAFWILYTEGGGLTSPICGIDCAIHYLGANGSFAAGPVNLSAEAVFRTGQEDTGANTDRDYSGYALAIEGSTTMNQISFGLLAGIASGDDNLTPTDTDVKAFAGINPSFNQTDIYFDGGDGGNGGAAFTGELGGVTILSPYATFAVNDQLNLGARYAWMQFTEVPSGVNDAIGSEIDLNVNYEIVPQLDLTVQLAWLFPDDGLTGGSPAKDDTLSEYMLRLKYTFGAAE